MREFRTKSIEEKDRLAERKVHPTRVEDVGEGEEAVQEFIYILEEDVPVEDILRVLKEQPIDESEKEDEKSEPEADEGKDESENKETDSEENKESDKEENTESDKEKSEEKTS